MFSPLRIPQYNSKIYIYRGLIETTCSVPWGYHNITVKSIYRGLIETTCSVPWGYHNITVKSI